MLAAMTSPTLDAEPACPGAPVALVEPTQVGAPQALRAERRAFTEIAPATWDDLAARNPWATPFSAWAFHRAWWDAYGDNAHEETVVVVPDDAPPGSPPLAIVPLMHRYEVEPTDALTHTRMRHGADMDLTAVSPSATGIFFGASYHSDYATILADPRDLPAVCAATAAYLAGGGAHRWDVVDLRRLRCGDPVAEELAAALGAREMAAGWTLNVEREDVCPVVTLPEGADIESWLATLGKKERHEIRRKVRRAEAVGDVRLADSTDPLADLGTFIDLHQKRWGDDGLFPPTRGGEQSRVLFRRLFELFGPTGPLRLAFLTVGDRRIAAGIHFETPGGYLYYNAGVDPDARELSPGVVMTYAYVMRAFASGKWRLDFLRGDEPYKYEWGAVDEPIQRLLVRRKD
jgi:CelD/BcsL family acetyltransferase involved in cellulose biosynthesis